MPKYATLTLTGDEKAIVSPLDRLCTAPGCAKYIDAGDYMVRTKNRLDYLHITCAAAWCKSHGKDATYAE